MDKQLKDETIHLENSFIWKLGKHVKCGTDMETINDLIEEIKDKGFKAGQSSRTKEILKIMDNLVNNASGDIPYGELNQKIKELEND